MTETVKKINSLKIKSLKSLEKGIILEGVVIEKKRNEIYVDLSPYGIGRLYGIFYFQCKELATKLKIGDKIGVKIVSLDDGYGNYEIILQEITEVNKWQKLFNYYRSNKVLELEIKDANRGGWLVEVDGIQGFIPVSQLSPEYYPRIENSNKNLIYEHLKKFIGQKIKCRIVSIDPKQNKLVLSEKAAKEEIYKEILGKLLIGSILKVKVVGFSPFGIFVRFNEDPPMDGLIHISEIPKEKVNNLETNFQLGQILEAKLIQIKTGKVGFSLINLKPDPWIIFNQKYKEGDKILGILKEKNDIFGVVETEGVKGVIFTNLNELEINKEYNFIIEKINPQEKSLILKLK